MKKLFFVLLIVPSLLVSNQVSASDEDILRDIKTRLWPKAYRTQDTALLDSILHESFQMTDDQGGQSDREKELHWIQTNQWDPGTFKYVIERLDIYDGKTAVVSGQGVAQNYTYRSSNFFIKQDGAWKAVASHVSGYKEK